mmetsp:Transcript_19026/g.32057  ORF Transcript_19026/g.32057 Transcript_19026/m.32057 type:complete len:462 (+) Transcript_19026:287-1672(+)
MTIIQTHVTSETAFICVQDAAHGLIAMCANLISLVAVARMKVEGKDQVAAFEDDDLVILILLADILMLGAHKLEAILTCLHQFIKGLKEFVAQQIILRQIPTTSAVMMTPAILRAREVDPLGVPKLVAHEVQIALAAQGQHDQTDHLVQRQAPIHTHGGEGTGEATHARVHLGIHEPKGQGLVTNNGLIVRLGVGNHLLHVASVGQSVHQVPHAPTIVRRLLEILDEHVRDRHCQTIVEAKAAPLHWQTQGGHATHILANCDGGGHHAVNQVVRQHQINVTINVCVGAEVFVEATGVALADAVGMVQHGGDTIKSEAVELVLLKPPLDVGEQEAKHLVLEVVEDLRVPVRMVSLQAAVSVAVISAIHLCDAIQRVGGGVGVDQVHEHLNSQAVCSVDQVLQLLRCSRTARWSIEGSDMIAKAAVVSMFCHSHQLHCIVAHSFDARQHHFGKLRVGGHLGVD